MDLLSVVLGGMGGVAAMGVTRHLQEHRTEPAGLADLLNWGFLVDDGIILPKDGSLLAGWRYWGRTSAPRRRRRWNALSQQQVNDAVLPFTGHVDVSRRRDPAAVGRLRPLCLSGPPDPAHRRRAARGLCTASASRQFETQYVLTSDPPPAAGRLLAAPGRSSSRAPRAASVDWTRVLETFATHLETLQSRLTPLHCARLDGERLLTHLHECLTGLPHPVRAPFSGAYLNAVLLGPGRLRRGLRAAHRADGRARRGHPGATTPTRPTQGTAISSEHAPVRLPVVAPRWVPLGTHAAAKQLRRHQLQWFKKRKGAAAWVQDLVGGKKDAAPRPDEELWVDQDARGLAQDAGDALAENASGGVRFCFSTQAGIVMDPDEARADQIAGALLKALTDAGFPGRVERVNAVDAYLGSLPGHGYPNLRRPLLSTRNIADLVPITSIWPGLATNPSPFFPPQSPPLLWAASAGATPFRVNLHHADVGHTLVLGKTGSGKSVLLAMLAAQFRRYPGAQVFAFDVGYSLWALAQASGARHYDLAAGRADALRFQPLARIDDPADRVWAAEWIETLCTLQGVPVTPPLRARIDRALALVSLNAPPHRTLTVVVDQLKEVKHHDALRPYTVAGTDGQACWMRPGTTSPTGASRCSS